MQTLKVKLRRFRQVSFIPILPFAPAFTPPISHPAPCPKQCLQSHPTLPPAASTLIVFGFSTDWFIMVMSEAMLRMIAPAQPREPNTAPHSTPSSSSSIRAQVTLASENDDPNPMSSAKRKRASQVVDIDTMVDASFMCCTKLRCVESFVLGTGDIAALRAEQKVLAAITGNQARSDFVNNLIPLVKPDKFSGAMLAGQRLVCTKFFRKAFNVSNNMIQALKNNDGSPASKGWVHSVLDIC